MYTIPDISTALSIISAEIEACQTERPDIRDTLQIAIDAIWDAIGKIDSQADSQGGA